MATTSRCGNSCLRRTKNSQAAQRIGTAVRRWRMITVVWWCRPAPLCRHLARCGHRHLLRLCLASDHAHQPAVYLFSLRSYYLSWSVSCFFGFGLCQSRRKVAVPLRPSRLGSGRPNGSACLSNASAVELHAPQNLRPFFPSTNSRPPYYHYLCHVILVRISSAICNFLTDV
jgi:hypothetical protein